MKKIFAIALCALTLVSTMLFASCQKKDDDKLVVGVTVYEPMNYLDENDNWTGFDTEFAQAVGKKLGKEVEFKEIDWDNKYILLDSDQIDCIWNGMTITEEGKKNCLISTPYAMNKQVVVMSKDVLDDYSDIESLKGLKFVAEAGSAGESAIKDNGLDENYTAVKSQSDALTALAANQADACVIDITMADASTVSGTSYEKFGYKIMLTEEEYGIAFRLDDTDLQGKVNDAIAELAEDGTLKNLAEKYDVTLTF